MATATPTEALALPEPVQRRGITESQWRSLGNLFPNGKPDSVLMVWDYCLTRKLDPFKKPCHIVPMRVRTPKGDWEWRDQVMPGIYEYRITAHRTGLYRGHSEPVYGPEVEIAGVRAPEWCAMTFYRAAPDGEKVAFPVKVWFSEVVATKHDGSANERWSKAPRQMLTKCTEAAGLRETCPEEFGGEQTAEEMEGRRLGDDDVVDAVPPPPPFVRKSDPPVVTHEPQAPPPSVEPPPPVAPEPAPVDDTPPDEERFTPAPAPMTGRIVDIIEIQPGVVIATLDSGFRCGTRNASMIAALHDLRARLRPIEIVAKKLVNTNNPNVVRVIEQILPLDEAEP